MILAPDEAALFYRAWWPLLGWVNAQRSILPDLPTPTPDRPIAPSQANPIREVLWADDTLREQFLRDGASGLGAAERELIASWSRRVSGSFVLYKHLQQYSIFLGDGDVFGVRGIYSPLGDLVPAPSFVDAVLLPFRDRIIIDGVLLSPGIQIGFGAGARRSMQAQYAKARAASKIRTTLQPPLPAAKPPAAKRSKPSRKTPSAPKPAASPDQQLRGTWRITATGLWDGDALDVDEPAFIRFDADRMGALRLLAIQADLDCRYAEHEGKPLVEFTFEGDDDGHPCSGRGRAAVEAGGTLRGRLFLHRGDDSDFAAEQAARPSSRNGGGGGSRTRVRK